MWSTTDVYTFNLQGAAATLFTFFHFFSSRSHLLLRLAVVGVDQLSKATTSGSLTLVDLAGSERISRSEATGSRLVEAAAINKSLSALGQVGAWKYFKAVPYRAQNLKLFPKFHGGGSESEFKREDGQRDGLKKACATGCDVFDAAFQGCKVVLPIRYVHDQSESLHLLAFLLRLHPLSYLCGVVSPRWSSFDKYVCYFSAILVKDYAMQWNETSQETDFCCKPNIHTVELNVIPQTRILDSH